MSDADIEKLGADQRAHIASIDVVLMSHCKAHFFHAECLTNQLGDKEWLKCAICSHKYGHETGNMPDGEMRIALNKSLLPGHEKDSAGTWSIGYSVQGGHNEKGRFSGDSRNGFLPHNAAGDEILALF